MHISQNYYNYVTVYLLISTIHNKNIYFKNFIMGRVLFFV